jgi:hypothetical protein
VTVLGNFFGIKKVGQHGFDLWFWHSAIAQSVHRLGYGLDNWESIPGRCKDRIFSLCHCVQTSSGAHPASYPMGNRGSWPWG